jgi:hypothetical protein
MMGSTSRRWQLFDGQVDAQRDADPPDQEGGDGEGSAAGGHGRAHEKRHDGYHHPLKGHDLDQGRAVGWSRKRRGPKQYQGQDRIDRLNHLTNSSVMTVAKKARAKEVSTNLGTLSMRYRAMTDSVTPTAV